VIARPRCSSPGASRRQWSGGTILGTQSAGRMRSFSPSNGNVAPSLRNSPSARSFRRPNSPSAPSAPKSGPYGSRIAPSGVRASL
jgi:hypothetical protein